MGFKSTFEGLTALSFILNISTFLEVLKQNLGAECRGITADRN